MTKCLESVFSLKTSIEFEVVLVDDGSSDNTLQIAQTYPLIKLIIADRNGGAAYARNLGARQSRGEVLFFVDSDVVLEANALDIALETRLRHGAVCVVGLFSPFNPFNDFFSQYKALYCHWKYQNIVGTSALNTAVTLLDRSAFESVGGFDASMLAAEDNEMGVRLYKAGYKIHVERTLEVLHIKQFSFKSLLKNDFKKSYSLAMLFFRHLHRGSISKEGEFSDISRGLMLNVPLSYLFLIFTLLIPSDPKIFLWSAMLFATIFAFNNRNFSTYLARRKSIWFATISLIFTFMDFLIVGVAVVAGGISYAFLRKHK